MFVFIATIMLAISPFIYKLWIGNIVFVPISTSAYVALWIVFNLWNGLFGQFLNGVGKIKIQLFFGIGTAILNIPLAIYLGMLYGVNGILLANIGTVIIGAVIFPIQYNKIINSKAFGIWNQ